MLGILIVRLFTGFIGSLCLAIFRERVLLDMQMRVFEHVEHLSLSYYDNARTGQLMSRIMNDGRNLEGLMAESILAIARNALTLLLVPIMMLSLNWKLGLISMCLLPALVVSASFFSPRIRSRSRQFQEQLASVYDTLQESLTGIRVVKSFCREKREAAKLFSALARSFRANLRYTRTLLTYSGVAATIGGIAPLVVFWYGGRQVVRNELTIGTLVAFQVLIGYVYGALAGLINSNANIQSSLASLKRINEILTIPTEPLDGGIELKKECINVAIVYHNVSFGYDGGRQVLRGISLRIEPGEVVAFVGRSGAGKTTLASLLLRFYEPNDGKILVGGTDIREISLSSLRSAIAIVPQEVFIFDGSITDNIRYGKPDATEVEIRKAAEAANAHHFINKLPQGYATKVGERGVRLSGGEKQRIAIARAVLKDCPILILDEATSEIDSESELLIQQALKKLMERRTTIVIAHRLSTVMGADKVVVIDGGRVCGVGRHEDLKRTNPIYRLLCKTQFKTGGSQL